jgi:selenoprotein W-related protein
LPNVEIEMIPSSGGRFEVVCDGTLIHSKKATGRHAEPGEVLRRLKAADTSDH